MRETFSLERFRNLVSVLGARQWSLPWYSPGTHILFSAPGADLLNHGSPGDVKNRFRANEHAFTMHAKRLLRKGEEVRKFYSPTCCERYLNAFGFAPVGRWGLLLMSAALLPLVSLVCAEFLKSWMVCYV